MITFKHGEVIKLPLKRKRNRVFLTPEVASTIVPREVKPGVNLSTLTGYLQVKDNLHNITVRELTVDANLRSCKTLHIEQIVDDAKDDTNKRTVPTREECLRKTKYEFGAVDVDFFCKKLMQDGITDVKMEQNGPGSVTITLTGEDTSIHISEQNTHIVCGGKQSLRLKLRDLLLQCVQKI